MAKKSAKKRSGKSKPAAKAGKTASKSKPAKVSARVRYRKTATKKARKASANLKRGESASASPGAVRLIFSYVGDEVKLISQQAVNMAVPPSDPVTGYKKEKGFWAELKSDKDKTLYRQVMHNPTRNDAEVFSDDPEQGISRQPAPKRKGVFVVLVPAVEAAAEVALSRSSGPPSGAGTGAQRALSLAAGPAKEIMRVKLKK